VIVGIFGGSFNPPHVGHVLAVVYALSVHPIDHVLVVPVFRHPFAKSLAPFSDRFAMCELAFGWLPRVSVSRVEEELGGDSLTLRTVEHLRAQDPARELRLVVGADVLPDAPKWHRFDRVVELAPLVVLGRGGHEGAGVPEVVLPTVSSTDVRAALAARAAERVRDLVPASVLRYALDHRLYEGTDGD